MGASTAGSRVGYGILVGQQGGYVVPPPTTRISQGGREL